MWSPENSLGLQMQVFPMLPRQDYFMEALDIAFILPGLGHPEERARSADRAARESSTGAGWPQGGTRMAAAPAGALQALRSRCSPPQPCPACPSPVW